MCFKGDTCFCGCYMALMMKCAAEIALNAKNDVAENLNDA
jgi:hypothetical protein